MVLFGEDVEALFEVGWRDGGVNAEDRVVVYGWLCEGRVGAGEWAVVAG